MRCADSLSRLLKRVESSLTVSSKVQQCYDLIVTELVWAIDKYQDDWEHHFPDDDLLDRFEAYDCDVRNKLKIGILEFVNDFIKELDYIGLSSRDNIYRLYAFDRHPANEIVMTYKLGAPIDVLSI